MNIAITGARGVGKVSLFRSLKIELPKEYKIHLLGETVFDEVKDTKSVLNYMRNQENILIQHIEAQTWSKHHRFNIMTSGSLIDVMANMIIGNHTQSGYVFPGDVKENIKTLHSLSPFLQEAIVAIRNYDLIFYLPIEFVCKGLSSEGFVRQKKADTVIREIMALYNIGYHTAIGSVDNRTTDALETIKQHMEGK